jgi:hypothetical protein
MLCRDAPYALMRISMKLPRRRDVIEQLSLVVMNIGCHRLSPEILWLMIGSTSWRED